MKCMIIVIVIVIVIVTIITIMIIITIIVMIWVGGSERTPTSREARRASGEHLVV